MTHCPTCRRQLAANDRNCSRCGTDLHELREWDQRANAAIANAAAKLLDGQTDDAWQQACQALAIDPENPAARQIAALAALARRDFPTTLAYYGQLNRSKP